MDKLKFFWTNITFRSLSLIFIVLCLLLSVYSYSQVDLNLTLSSNSVYQSFQNQLTQLGYFNRDISALIYIVLVVCMTCVYCGLIYQSKSKAIKNSTLHKLLLIISALLLFAYPAFSYDIFNYIFDARILVEHQVNPYTHTALDFPDDTWTRFMRWTHRTYPYGPTWLPISIIFYLLGLGKFVLTLLSFKLMAALSYIGSFWAIKIILEKVGTKKDVQQALVLFMFNPLVIIEVLVSGHLDAVMMALMLSGIAALVLQKKILGVMSLFVSAAIKYVSAFVLIPFYFFYTKKIDFKKATAYSIILSYGLTLVVISQREILPWYFLVPFGLTVLLPQKKHLVNFMLAATPALLLRYAPFLYIGEYSEWVISMQHLSMVIIFIVIFLILEKTNFSASKN